MAMDKNSPHPTSSEPMNPPASDAGRRPISPLIRWGFRLAACFGVPLVLVTMAEAIARWSGVGYRTDFFSPRQTTTGLVWSENPTFGYRFFPKELARVPTPLLMAGTKPKGTHRIFVFGESAALGDPEPAFGLGRYLEALLEEHYPGSRFEVIPAAMTAINSHALLPIARECTRHEGDLWVVYMGNNEFVGPFGAGTVLGPQVPPLPWIRATLALHRLHLVQWMEEIIRSKPSGSQPAAWGGMKMFLEAQVPPADPRKAKVYSAFERNLNDLLEAARAHEIPVILCTVGSNLKDCAPFASTNSPALQPLEAESIRTAFDKGERNITEGRWSEARNRFNDAVQKAPGNAALFFELARCELALSNPAAARSAFIQARNFDSLPFRADSSVNDVIRRVAAQRKMELVDTVEILERNSPQGIPGNEFFHDHVHLNFRGNYLLARSIAEDIRLNPFKGLATEKATNSVWAVFEQASARLALTDWDERRVLDNMGRRISEPPFSTQLNHTNELERLRSELRRIRSRRTARTVSEARNLYESVLQREPSDYWVRGNFAKFLEDNELWSEAHSAWTSLQQQLPWEPGPYLFLGKVALREKMPDEALKYFDQALAIRPDLSDALLEKGRIWVGKKEFDKARTSGEMALQYQPNNGRIHLALAEIEIAGGNTNAAIARLREAVDHQPSLWEAYYLLGLQHVARSDWENAREQFATAVQLRPDYAPARFNLAVALTRLNQLGAARNELEAVVRLDPENAKAREYLKSLQGK